MRQQPQVSKHSSSYFSQFSHTHHHTKAIISWNFVLRQRAGMFLAKKSLNTHTFRVKIFICRHHSAHFIMTKNILYDNSNIYLILLLYLFHFII